MARTLTLTLSLALATLGLSGCTMPLPSSNAGQVEEAATQDNRVTSEEEIVSSLLFAMENNQESCTFIVEDKELIDIDSWLLKLPGLTGVNCTYIAFPGYTTVQAKLTYWDNYPIIHAYKTGRTSSLNERQLALYDKYCQIIKENTSITKTAAMNELAIHDYLVDNITYSGMTAEYAAYDALFTGNAVCMGYAECFQTLMEMLGIECVPVTGYADGQSHIWNMVCLDNEWYQVDVTWDDPSEDSVDGLSHHSYFNITDTDMYADHTPDMDNLQRCLGTRYAYYNMCGYQSVSSQAELNSYVSEQVGMRSGSLNILYKSGISLPDLRQALERANVAVNYQVYTTKREGYTTCDVALSYK